MASRIACSAGALLALVGGVGCDSEPSSSGMAGIYVVTSHSESRPCDGTPYPLTNDPPYFEIVDRKLSNRLFVDAFSCTGPDRASCDEQGFPLVFEAKPISGGRFLAQLLSTNGTGTCLVSWRGDYLAPTATGVTMTIESRTGEWSGADCEGNLSEVDFNRAATLACSVAEVTTGEPVAAP